MTHDHEQWMDLHPDPGSDGMVSNNPSDPANFDDPDSCPDCGAREWMPYPKEMSRECENCGYVEEFKNDEEMDDALDEFLYRGYGR